MAKTMLEIRDLYCGYPHKPVLHGVSLSVAQGDVVGVIGPNGSGKTTLLRAATRVLKPSSGTIHLAGDEIQRLSFKQIACRVAVVSQNTETSPLGVEDYVLLGRLPYRGRLQFWETSFDRKIVQQSLEMTGAMHLRRRLLSQLSGGERQLICVARALAQKPRLLILDEPTTHLDITHQIGLLDLVKRLNRQYGLTVVMVLHDLNLAAEYCHRLVLLHQGRVHSTGTPRQVLTYQIIEDVYKTIVVVETNPISGKPFVLAVSEEAMGLPRVEGGK